MLTTSICWQCLIEFYKKNTSNSSKLFLGSLVKKGNLVQIVILFGVSFSMIRIPTKSYLTAS